MNAAREILERKEIMHLITFIVTFGVTLLVSLFSIEALIYAVFGLMCGYGIYGGLLIKIERLSFKYAFLVPPILGIILSLLFFKYVDYELLELTLQMLFILWVFFQTYFLFRLSYRIAISIGDSLGEQRILHYLVLILGYIAFSGLLIGVIYSSNLFVETEENMWIIYLWICLSLVLYIGTQIFYLKQTKAFSILGYLGGFSLFWIYVSFELLNALRGFLYKTILPIDILIFVITLVSIIIALIKKESMLFNIRNDAAVLLTFAIIWPYLGNKVYYSLLNTYSFTVGYEKILVVAFGTLFGFMAIYGFMDYLNFAPLKKWMFLIPKIKKEVKLEIEEEHIIEIEKTPEVEVIEDENTTGE